MLTTVQNITDHQLTQHSIKSAHCNSFVLGKIHNLCPSLPNHAATLLYIGLLEFCARNFQILCTIFVNSVQILIFFTKLAVTLLNNPVCHTSILADYYFVVLYCAQ